jgi:hypothetical protein
MSVKIVGVTQKSGLVHVYTPPLASPNHRYWRISLGAAAVASPFLIYEVGFCSVVNGPSVTTGGTAFASEDPGNTASHLFDGDITTAWYSSDANLPQYVGYDFGFGNTVDIVEVFLTTTYSADALEMPKSGDVQYSDDGFSWTTKFSFGPYTWADNETHRFS